MKALFTAIKHIVQNDSFSARCLSLHLETNEKIIYCYNHNLNMVEELKIENFFLTKKLTVIQYKILHDFILVWLTIEVSWYSLIY